MSRLRYVSSVFLTAAVIFFALQNLDVVQVRFLRWRLNTSLSLVALGPFLVGLLLGGITALYYARRRRTASQGPPALPEQDEGHTPAAQPHQPAEQEPTSGA